MRTTWEKIYFRLAFDLASRSTCSRRHVGCVITSEDHTHVLGVGYNGREAGEPSNSCARPNESGNCGCFPANVKVETKEGREFINKIKVGDYVLTHKNRYRPVEKIFRKKYTGKFVYLNMSFNNGNNNKKRFVSTEEHPVLVERDNKISWKKAIDVKIGDTVFCPSHKCVDCDKLVPFYRTHCNKCFRSSAWSDEFRKRVSERMKKDNPMKRMYHTKVIKNKAVESLVKKQKAGQKKLKETLLNHFKENGLDKKYRCVIVDHIGVRPDAILIDWENRKVIAYEYEKWQRNVNESKYDGKNQFDEVKWYVENKNQDDRGLYNGFFSRIKVTGKKVTKRSCFIYNLEVEEDHTYICQNVIVHNCLHAEDNAIIKVSQDQNTSKIAYVTHMPCEYCARRFVNKGGFKKIYYVKDYRLTTGIDLLKERGIEVIQYVIPIE